MVLWCTETVAIDFVPSESLLQLNYWHLIIITIDFYINPFSALTLLVGRQEGHPACKKLSGGLLAWLSVWSKVQTCIWPSWCHCHSLSLASVKSRLVLPFWYRLTRVVPEKGPLNARVCVCKALLGVAPYTYGEDSMLEIQLRLNCTYLDKIADLSLVKLTWKTT